VSVHDLLAAAQVQPVYGVTTDRVWATAAVLLALAGAVIGVLALARSRRTGTGNGRRGAIVAVAAGLFAALNGVLVLVTADGGPGTGNGVIGGYAALVLGLIAAGLGTPVLTRSRKTVTS
jgi:hypothetical protein